MTGPDPDVLAELLQIVDDRFAAGDSAADVIQHLVAHHGATVKAGDTNALRLAAVTGTCAWSQNDGLLGSWRRNAQKRITPGIGHNSAAHHGPAHHGHAQSGGATATDDRLRLLVERIERLEEEEQGVKDDKRDVYAEAKAVGYDAKTVRQIVRLRKMAPADRREADMILDTYKAALGMD